MYLSVIVSATDEGYVPRIVFQNPHMIRAFEVGGPCSTWKEAYIVGRAMSKDKAFVQQQVATNA